MKPNRAMPQAGVIPVLAYEDVGEAVAWLCRCFGFTLRWQAGDHRAQLNAGTGCVVITAGTPAAAGHSIMVRVADVDAHHAQAREAGAQILSDPTSFPYGERQYGVADPSGRCWTFSQSVDDVDPASWGAVVGEL